MGGELQLQFAHHSSGQPVPRRNPRDAPRAFGLEHRTPGIGVGGELPAPQVLIWGSIVYSHNAVAIDIALQLPAG